jgi:hypothetical protein
MSPPRASKKNKLFIIQRMFLVYFKNKLSFKEFVLQTNYMQIKRILDYLKQNK